MAKTSPEVELRARLPVTGPEGTSRSRRTPTVYGLLVRDYPGTPLGMEV